MSIILSESDIRKIITESLLKENMFRSARRSGEGRVSLRGKRKDSEESETSLSGEEANFGPSSSVASTVSDRATRLGNELGIDPAWIYAEEAKESGHNPKAMAWNLHIATKDRWAEKAGVSPLTREQKQKLKDAGLPVGQTKSYYGADAKRAFQTAFEISPAHAIIGGAWGLYQVLGAFSLPTYNSDPAKWRREFESNPVRHSEEAFKVWIENYGSSFKDAVNRGDYAYTTAKYYGAPNPEYQNFITKHVRKFRQGQDRDSGQQSAVAEGLFRSARKSREGTVSNTKKSDRDADLALMPDDSRDPSAIHPDFRGIVDEIMDDLRAAGFEPKIGSGYRSAKSQQEKIDKGYSKSPHLIGHHTSLDVNGNRAAYAVDLVQKEAGWSETKEAYDFFEALGKIVEGDDNITWGGSWRPKRDKTIDGKTYKQMGWDPAHIQWNGISREQIEVNTREGIKKIKSRRAVS